MKLFKRQIAGRNAKNSNLSASKMTYYRGARQGRTDQPRPDSRKRRVVSRAGRKLLWLAVLSLVIFSLIVDRPAKIKVDNLSYRSSENYDAAVNKQLSALTNRFKPTLNELGVEQKLQISSPEISQVKIDLPLHKRTPEVKISISSPSFILAGATTAQANHEKFVVASNGKVIGRLADFPKMSQLPLLTDRSNIPIKIGEVVLGKGTSGFILSIISEAKKNNIEVASFNLPQGSQQIELRTADKSYFVKFSVEPDPAIQIGQWLAARAHFAASGINPSQYLDVRVNGRIYYK